MTVLLPPAPPWFRLTLDTVGPGLTIADPGIVQPPDVLETEAVATEPVAEASATFTDALGVAHPVGVVVSDTSIRLSLPTVGFPTGRGTLRVLARDLACNVGSASVLVFIDRPRPFDLTARTTGAFDVSTSAGGALLDLAASTSSTFDLDALPDEALETQTVTSAVFDLTSETNDG